MNEVICNINWTAIGAIATALMTIATFITLIYNSRQSRELRKQWNEEHRARVVFSAIVSPEGMFCLKVQNIGKQPAYNINYKINDDFLDAMLIKEFSDIIRKREKYSLSLMPNEAKYYALTPQYGQSINVNFPITTSYSKEEVKKNIDSIMELPIKVVGSYNNKYYINEEFIIREFIAMSVVVDDPVVKELKLLTKQIKELNKFLIKKVESFSVSTN